MSDGARTRAYVAARVRRGTYMQHDGDTFGGRRRRVTQAEERRRATSVGTDAFAADPLFVPRLSVMRLGVDVEHREPSAKQ